jgi:hypothetical protein
MRAPSGTKTAPNLRIVSGVAVCAGIMASNMGRAMVTPRPFKKVRLGKDRFWMNIVISFIRNYF